MSEPVSLQLYTIRDALAADPAAAVERVAGLGYRHVEPFDLVRFAGSLRDVLAAHGIAAPSAHSHLIGVDLEPVLDAASFLGVGTVIDSSIADHEWASEARVVAQARALNSAARIAAARGIQLGYHNHWWELQASFSGVTGLEVFAHHLDPEVALEVDAYWAAVGGADPVELIGRLGERVRFIHVKDGDLSRDMSKQVPAGQGRVPIGDILSVAGEALPIVEFDDYAGDVFEGILQSLDYLRKNGR